MAEPQDTISGFSDHVQQQLRQAANDVQYTQPTRGRGHRGRGHQHHPHPHQQRHRGNVGPPHHQQPNSRSWSQQPIANLADVNSFPPLGASRPQPSAPAQRLQQQQPIINLPQQNLQHPTQSQRHFIPPHTHDQRPVRFQPSHHTNGEHQFRGNRGGHRGRGHHNFGNNQYQPYHQFQTQNPDEFNRPAPMQRQLFAPNMHPHFQSMDEQRALHRKNMDQSDFLNYLAMQALRCKITPEEQQEKESFRKELETIAQKAVEEHHATTMDFSVSEVGLKVYGSLGSGFGVSSSDMDLLLAFPQDKDSLGDIEIESRRQLEKALLDAGIGARLLTKTRVPILRVCQRPSPELLKNLREYRNQWELEPESDDQTPNDDRFCALPSLTESQAITTQTAFAELSVDAHEVPLPASPTMERSKLEFDGDCGILCDINFANYLALENTRLLKAYGICDPRVVDVGVFVKTWAKSRDIKTPYRGTLSSYGYLMLVLHYLMNIANPPLIPNLQELAKQKDAMAGRTEIELFKGYDVRFVADVDEIRSIMQVMPRNHESVGSLLRGFFHYYADARGFHWNQDVISIRSPGGRLTKRAKGWTEAKWAGDKQHVRLRYLLAIEDPFELEHNVGRTVGHSGIVAIRDEFRRAWSAIENVKQDEDRSWYWLSQEGQKVSGDKLMSAVENRGDLLRKDQDYHRNKTRQLRQALEAKEKALRDAATQDNESQDEVESNGMFEVGYSCRSRGCRQCALMSPTESAHNDEHQVSIRQHKTTSQRTILENSKDGLDDGIRLTCKMIQVTSKEVKRKALGKLLCQPWTAFAAYERMRAEMRQMGNAASNATSSQLRSRLRCSQHTRTHVTSNSNWYPRALSNHSVRDERGSNQTSTASIVMESAITKDSGTKAEENGIAAIFEGYQCSNYCHNHVLDTVLPTVEPANSSKQWQSQNDSGLGDLVVREDTNVIPRINQTTQLIHQNGPCIPDFDFDSNSEDQREAADLPLSPRISCGDSSHCQNLDRLQSQEASTTNENTDHLAEVTAILTESQQQLSQPITSISDHENILPLPALARVPNPHRSRHDDPNFMPIPSAPNFQFDPRQLADLEMIRRGGNGCAKAGEEFEIEVDGEYGGCGIMAQGSISTLSFKSVVTPWLDGDCYPGDRGLVNLEYDGDTMGLLDELPGFMGD